MIHALITIVWCVLCILFNLSLAMLFIPSAFYLGREIAQAEYRYIEAHGRKRTNCPWWCGFMPEAWNAKACLDCLLPALVSSLASCFAYALKWL